MNTIEGMNQTPTTNFGLKDTTEVKCESCDNIIFQNGIIFRKVSKLMAGTDKDALVPINIPYCTKCGETLQELLPSELKSDNSIETSNIVV